MGRTTIAHHAPSGRVSRRAHCLHVQLFASDQVLRRTYSSECVCYPPATSHLPEDGREGSAVSRLPRLLPSFRLTCHASPLPIVHPTPLCCPCRTLSCLSCLSSGKYAPVQRQLPKKDLPRLFFSMIRLISLQHRTRTTSQQNDKISIFSTHLCRIG